MLLQTLQEAFKQTAMPFLVSQDANREALRDVILPVAGGDEALV